MAKEKVRPCPFCGSCRVMICKLANVYCVECAEVLSCGAKGPSSSDRSKAIYKWNCRFDLYLDAKVIVDDDLPERKK